MLSDETGSIPDCGFYLPVSMSRNDPVDEYVENLLLLFGFLGLLSRMRAFIGGALVLFLSFSVFMRSQCSHRRSPWI